MMRMMQPAPEGSARHFLSLLNSLICVISSELSTLHHYGHSPELDELNVT
jgi:hypothetical protein